MPESHWHVRLGNHGNLRGIERGTGRVIGHSNRSVAGSNTPASWVFARVSEDNSRVRMCCVAADSLAGFPLRESSNKTESLSQEKQPRPSVPIWVLLLCLVGKKKIFPSISNPLPGKSNLTRIQIETKNTHCQGEGRHDFSSIHHVRSLPRPPPPPVQGEIFLREHVDCGVASRSAKTRR